MIRSAGGKEFSANKLNFSISAFSSPTTAKSSAVQWRLARISAPGLNGYTAGESYRYEIEPGWTSGELKPDATNIQLPPEACFPGQTYRVRARYKDDTGRWSHWSPPIQFVAESK
jgi:hypothetical protein